MRSYKHPEGKKIKDVVTGYLELEKSKFANVDDAFFLMIIFYVQFYTESTEQLRAAYIFRNIESSTDGF